MWLLGGMEVQVPLRGGWGHASGGVSRFESRYWAHHSHLKGLGVETPVPSLTSDQPWFLFVAPSQEMQQPHPPTSFSTVCGRSSAGTAPGSRPHGGDAHYKLCSPDQAHRGICIDLQPGKECDDTGIHRGIEELSPRHSPSPPASHDGYEHNRLTRLSTPNACSCQDRCPLS